MAYLLGIIGALIGTVVFFKTKAQSAGSLLENDEAKKASLKHDSAIANNVGRISAEQDRINALRDSSQKELEKKESNEALADFFNKYSKPE